MLNVWLDHKCTHCTYQVEHHTFNAHTAAQHYLRCMLLDQRKTDGTGCYVLGYIENHQVTQAVYCTMDVET